MELPVTSRRLGALVATFVLLTISALDARAGIGRTPGFASVSEDGDAQYAIPIALPPGTNGMTPVLELAYNHRTRGGLVGIGWSIGGLSQITRCARTVAQDGIAGAPRRSTNDRFCLDGQRLVIVNSVVYGSPNAEYRTEIESFSRIRAVDGASTNGPASFTVEAADGRVYEYGATNDSRIDGTPGPSTNSARSWALSRIRDRAGNVIEYRYTEEPGSLAHRIASILYNANPTNGVAPSHEVRFVWEKRPDSEIDAGYVAGMPVREIMRLAAIEIRYGNATLRRIEFAYEPALSSGGRSRLATLRECGGDGTDCLSPTGFEWTDGTPGFGPVISFAATAPATGYYPEGKAWNLADLNGDGRDDYVWAGGSDLASSTVRYRLSQPDGAIGGMTDTGISARPGVGAPFDADGDGRTDLLLITTGGFAVAPGDPSGLGAPLATGVPTPAGLRDYRGADLNGDGLGDIAWSEVPDPQVNSLRVRAAFARAGGGFGAPVTLYSQYEAVGYLNAEGGEFIGRPGQRIDFDGDGAEELLMNENDTFARISATAYGTEFFDARPGKPVVLDFNDDRCTDFAYPHVASRSIRIRASECVIEGSRLELQGPAWIGSGDMLGLDWNGDGRDDLLTRGQRNWMVAVSRGDSATTFADTGVPHEASPAIAGRDLDGDGLQDIAVLTPGQLRARFRSGVAPDLLAGAIDGFGISTAFTYGPLTDPGLYARGNAAAWPEPTVQTNALVVAALATTDGSGESRLSSAQFRYEGLRRNVQGRGSLGFRKFTRVDGTGSDRLSTVLTRRQDFPFTGLPETVALRGPADVAVSSIDYRWSTLDIGTLMNARRFPWPSSITTRHFEPGGALAGRELIRTTSSIAAIDPASGLATDATTTISELGGGTNPGSQSSVRVQYTGVFNDSMNWCLGRPLAVEITASHTLAGGSPLARYADQSWDGPKCRPTRVRLLPGDAASQVTYNLAYDAFGNVASEKVTGAGMAARTLATNWGSRGRLPARITDPLGQVARYAWDAGTGQPKSFTDPNGVVTQWDYDAFGRVIRERAADGTVTQWTREACATGCDPRTRYRLRQEDLDGTGVVRALATQEADRFDRAIRVETQEPGGGRSVATIDFGPRGEMARRHLPHWDGSAAPGFVEFSYDELGRPTGERLVEAGGALKRQSSIAYEGLSVTSTDALGHSTTAIRLAWGPLAETVDALSGRTRYEYNAFGALARVRDAANGIVATIGYDARGWKSSVNDADRGAWTWTRNALGETTALRDAKGQLSQFEYDALGRLTRRTSPDGVAAWNWGKTPANRDIGRLASLSGPGYAESFTYDAAGRPSSHVVTTDASYRFDYAYNALGLLDTLTYPAAGSGSPFRIRHDYDAGRLVRVGDASAPGRFLWTLNAVDAAGHALDETFGASIRMVTGFSPVGGEIDYRQTSSASGTPAQDLAYRWDAAGNLASRQDLVQGLTEDFRYDALDRLTQSRRNGSVSLELDYDALGNLRRKSDVCTGTAPCYAYHATKRHAAVTVGTRAYAYDANGNMTSRAGAAIAWNSDDRPVSIAHANGNSSQFAYGPEGNRWKQVAINGGASETTIYVDGMFEKSTRGGLTTWRHYLMAPGGAVLHLRFSDGTPAAMRYLAIDHLGSADRILDSAGNVVAAESFAPFGTRRKASWTGIPMAAELATIAATARDGFTGHEQLDNVELIHMNGRVYDPQLGRFISADPYVMRPYDGQGLNRYSYALNNPLAFTDPSGFDPIPCAETPEGHCAQITVIGVSWAEYLRAVGGAHSAEIASALERDPCGQNGSALACAMQTSRLVSPSSIQLTAGRQPDPTLASGGRLDSIRGFAARAANVAISSSPVAMLFGADPDFEYFRIPDNDAGRAGATAGSVASFIGGTAGIVRKAGSEIATRGPSVVARSMQGSGKYPLVDRFRDITLKKGTIVYAGFPGQGAFYTTANALRRSGQSGSALWEGLQVARHEQFAYRTRMAAYEVVEDTPAAFGLAMANIKNGAGGYPQIVVPSFRTSLRYLHDFALAP